MSRHIFSDSLPLVLDLEKKAVFEVFSNLKKLIFQCQFIIKVLAEQHLSLTLQYKILVTNLSVTVIMKYNRGAVCLSPHPVTEYLHRLTERSGYFFSMKRKSSLDIAYTSAVSE